MANPTVTAAVLANDAGTYRSPLLNSHQRRALKVYGKILELAAIGGGADGTDYRDATDKKYTTLAEAAQTLQPGATMETIEAAQVAIQFTKVTAASGTAPADVHAALLAIPGLLAADDLMLAKMDHVLDAKLGVHKAYTQ